MITYTWIKNSKFYIAKSIYKINKNGILYLKMYINVYIHYCCIINYPCNRCIIKNNVTITVTISQFPWVRNLVWLAQCLWLKISPETAIKLPTRILVSSEGSPIGKGPLAGLPGSQPKEALRLKASAFS